MKKFKNKERYRQIKNIVGAENRKPQPFSLNIDTDRDGVVDWKDCKPFDYYQQHSGPSELPVATNAEVVETYMHVVTNASKRYGGRKKAIKLGKHIVSAKLNESHHSPKGKWDLREQGYPVFSFKTSYRVHPNKTIIEVYDEAKDVHFYANTTKYFHKYSALMIDDVYEKGFSGQSPKLILFITGIDREKLGQEGMNKLLAFALEENISLWKQ